MPAWRFGYFHSSVMIIVGSDFQCIDYYYQHHYYIYNNNNNDVAIIIIIIMFLYYSCAEQPAVRCCYATARLKQGVVNIMIPFIQEV